MFYDLPTWKYLFWHLLMQTASDSLSDPPPCFLDVFEEIHEETLQDTAPAQPSMMEPMHNNSSEPPQDNTGSPTLSIADHNPRLSQESLGLAIVSAITMPSRPVVGGPVILLTTKVRRSNRSNKYKVSKPSR